VSALGRDLQRAADPAIFARDLGVAPDEWQAAALRSDARQALWLCSRQSGKSTTAALRALHRALYEPGSLVLIVSMGMRQSQELHAKILALYRRLGRPVPAESENVMSLTLENASRIVALPAGGTGDTLRGYSSVDELIVDEAARVPDALLVAVRPMLAVSGGRLTALSTPAGRRGWFYAAFVNGGAEYERVEIRAEDCPRISASFLESEKRALGEWMFSQEYLCQWLEGATQAFTERDIAKLFDPEVEAWNLTY
jgi:hypothetical protein